MNDDKALVFVRGRQGMRQESRSRLLARWVASGLSARAFALEAGVAGKRPAEVPHVRS